MCEIAYQSYCNVSLRLNPCTIYHITSERIIYSMYIGNCPIHSKFSETNVNLIKKIFKNSTGEQYIVV